MKFLKLYPISVFVLILFSVTFTSCKNAVSGEDEHHAKPHGFQLSMNDEIVVNKLPYKPLLNEFPELTVSDESDIIEVWFYDFHEDLFRPDEHGLFLEIEINNPDLLQAKIAEDGWSFTLTPLSEGQTTFTLHLMHGSHPDFSSAPITVNFK